MSKQIINKKNGVHKLQRDLTNIYFKLYESRENLVKEIKKLKEMFKNKSKYRLIEDHEIERYRDGRQTNVYNGLICRYKQHAIKIDSIPRININNEKDDMHLKEKTKK